MHQIMSAHRFVTPASSLVSRFPELKLEVVDPHTVYIAGGIVLSALLTAADHANVSLEMMASDATVSHYEAEGFELIPGLGCYMRRAPH
jgi:hypothetical protein